MQRPYAVCVKSSVFPAFCLSAIACFALLLAQRAAAQSKESSGTRAGATYLAFGFAAAGANDTAAKRFWLEGGNAEVNSILGRGLGFTASVLGLHTSDAGNRIPVNLVATTAGPSYRRVVGRGSHAPVVFLHGLVGEASGFGGLYPSPTGPVSSRNSLAVRAGGGFELQLHDRLGIRLIEADWLHTQFPDAANNFQNDFYLDAGLFFRLH
jgi:peptidoglycan-associated lipoprotein